MLRLDTMSDKDTLEDIDHTPPTGDPVANVWDRGSEQAD